MDANWGSEAKWRIRIRLLDQYYDDSVYYCRNYKPSDASGVRFYKAPEYGAEMAERLLAMCRWKEKLEVKDYAGRRIVSSNEEDALISLRPEQELLSEEKEKIEKERYESEGWRMLS